MPLPQFDSQSDSEPFLRLWEHKVLRLLLDAQRIDPDVVENMRSWRHSGFSVDRSVFLAPGDREARRRWAALIQRVFEVDPLECPECGGTMRVICFIERRQTDVIERILRHCELWDPPTRGPPGAQGASEDGSATDLTDLEVELDRRIPTVALGEP